MNSDKTQTLELGALLAHLIGISETLQDPGRWEDPVFDSAYAHGFEAAIDAITRFAGIPGGINNLEVAR